MSQPIRKSQRPSKLRMVATQPAAFEMHQGGDPLQSPEECHASKVRHLARHLLHASSSEKDGALRDAVAQKIHHLSKREYCYMLKQASHNLQRSFGFHRVNQSHIVRMEPIEQCHYGDTLCQAKRGLLSAILMFIFLSKSKKSNVDCITEAVLENFLKSLGVSYDTPDPVFGDVKKLISPSHTAHFVHNGYISFAKSSDRSGTQVFTFDWGPRAIIVCEPKTILESFCAIINDGQVEMWEDQVQTVKQFEEERRKILDNSERYIEGES